MVLFCFVACAFMAAGRIVRLKSAGLMLASALAALGLILAAECALYPGVFEAYAGRHASQVRSTEGRLGIWKRSAGLVRALALAFTASQMDTARFAQSAPAPPPGTARPA
jgi:hypothetical protein